MDKLLQESRKKRNESLAQSNNSPLLKMDSPGSQKNDLDHLVQSIKRKSLTNGSKADAKKRRRI